MYVTSSLPVSESQVSIIRKNVKPPRYATALRVTRYLPLVFVIGCANTPNTEAERLAECESMQQRLPGLRVRAEDEHAEAQYRLGDWYSSGQCITTEYETGLQWYQKAADQGHSQAMFAVGEAYYYGQGVPQDRIQGMQWYRRASQAGHKKAKQTHDQLASWSAPMLLKASQPRLSELGTLTIVTRTPDAQPKLEKPRGATAGAAGKLGTAGVFGGLLSLGGGPIGAALYGGIMAVMGVKTGIEHGQAGQAIHEELDTQFSEMDLSLMFVEQMRAVLGETELESVPQIVLTAADQHAGADQWYSSEYGRAETIVELTFEKAALENTTPAWQFENTNRPGLVLTLRAKVRALRASDGQVLFQESLKYEGEQLLSWQEQPFREEVERAVHQLAGRVLVGMVVNAAPTRTQGVSS